MQLKGKFKFLKSIYVDGGPFAEARNLRPYLLKNIKT